jgi:hypothetical protein
VNPVVLCAPLFVAAIAALVARQPRRAVLLVTMADCMVIAAEIGAHRTLVSCVSAAHAGFGLWLWWYLGGGRGGRRRIRRVLRRFIPVRRSAPQSAK